MDYVRIKSPSLMDTFDVSVQASCNDASNASAKQLAITDVKELLKDWIRLYPNSFAPDMVFRIYQLEDGDVIIRLHEDMSSLAASLLVLYLESMIREAETKSRIDTKSESLSQSLKTNSPKPTAYITIDDTEVLSEQCLGKRTMIFSGLEIECDEEIRRSTIVRFLFDDNYYHEHDFKSKSLHEEGGYYGRPSLFHFDSEEKPETQLRRRDYYMQFEESEFSLPEDYEVVKVGEVVKNEIDEMFDTEDLTYNKSMWYLICSIVGLGIGFLIVYLMGM